MFLEHSTNEYQLRERERENDSPSSHDHSLWPLLSQTSRHLIDQMAVDPMAADLISVQDEQLVHVIKMEWK